MYFTFLCCQTEGKPVCFYSWYLLWAGPIASVAHGSVQCPVCCVLCATCGVETSQQVANIVLSKMWDLNLNVKQCLIIIQILIISVWGPSWCQMSWSRDVNILLHDMWKTFSFRIISSIFCELINFKCPNEIINSNCNFWKKLDAK